METSPAILFLAAGSSQRFGQNKLLMRDQEGECLAIKTAKLYAHLKNKWALLSRPQSELELPLQHLGYQVQVVESSPSLSASLQHLLKVTPNATSWLVALADMPDVRRESIDQLFGCLLEGASLVVPRYLGQRGNPVGFSAHYYDYALSLGQDEGLRGLLEKDNKQVTWVDLDDPGILLDIDQTSDWWAFMKRDRLVHE